MRRVSAKFDPLLTKVKKNFLFPRMKKNLKGKPFDDVEAVKIDSQRALDDIKRGSQGSPPDRHH